MLNSFWNWFAIIVTIASILACLVASALDQGHFRSRRGRGCDTGHTWDNDIRELNNPLPRWWLHAFNLTIVFALIYLVLFPGLGNFAGTLGWTQEGRYQGADAAAEAAQAEIFARYSGMTPQQLMADPEAMGTGRRLFGQNCAMCHGSDGRGAYGFPNLTDSEWQWGSGHQNILTAINSGRQAAMPPWGDALGEDGVAEVTEYVMQISGNEVSEQLASAGAQKYTMFCVACHGADGKGNPILGAPDLTNDVWLYAGNRETIAEGLVLGRNGNMPAFGDQLSEQRRNILAAYVMSLSEGDSVE